MTHDTRPPWADTTEPLSWAPDRAAYLLAEFLNTLAEHYCAGGPVSCKGFESAFWMATFPPRPMVHHPLRSSEGEKLRQLAVTAGGWVVWGLGDGPDLFGDEGDGPRLVLWKSKGESQKEKR